MSAELALARRLLRFRDYLTETYGRPIRLDHAELSCLDEHAQFELTMARIAEAGVVDELSPAILRHQVTSHEDTRALERHIPLPYAGHVVLYRATHPTPWAVRDPRFDRTDDALGWEAVCPGLTVVPVPGHHLNLLDPPCVGVIAAHLDSLLSEGTP